MFYVILSTFNGEKYLVEQLESLLGQNYSPIKILIRDDGSTDKTVNLLKSYEEKHENIEVIYGKNIGVIQSFFELLHLVPESAAYIALCDQDDIWINTKISRAVEQLSQADPEKASLYFCRLNIVDEKLNTLFLSRLPSRAISFSNALVENIATGCSMVLNQQALRLLKNKHPDFKKIQMHDAWIYQVISALGKVIYDTEPQILYRQHSSNTVGAQQGLSLLLSRIKRFVNQKSCPKFLDQAIEFKKLYYSQLMEIDQITLDKFIQTAQASNVVERIKFILRNTVYRQKKIDNFILKILFVFRCV
jgi:glycosyltransferase involved in cell wall biosynthesis